MTIFGRGEIELSSLPKMCSIFKLDYSKVATDKYFVDILRAFFYTRNLQKKQTAAKRWRYYQHSRPNLKLFLPSNFQVWAIMFNMIVIATFEYPSPRLSEENWVLAIEPRIQSYVTDSMVYLESRNFNCVILQSDCN